MRRFYSIWALTILLVSFAATMLAQAPAAAPKISEDELLLVQAVATVGQLATTDCNNLDSVKRFRQQEATVNTRLEKKYPGFKLDWSTGALVTKPVAPAK